MRNIIDKLLSQFSDKLPIVRKKRRCKYKNCPTILSQYDPHKYCFFHYEIVSIDDDRKKLHYRVMTHKVLNKKHKWRISRGLKLWWQKRKQSISSSMNA